MFKMTIFVSTHNYLLKSLKFVIEQNHFIDLTIDSPIIVIVNFYNLIPKRTIKVFLPRNYEDMESPTVTIFDGDIRGQSNNLDFYSFVHNIPESIIAVVFSSVVIDYFRKVIDNKLKKTKIPTNKQNREMK
jgi:hypothetical protein